MPWNHRLFVQRHIFCFDIEYSMRANDVQALWGCDKEGCVYSKWPTCSGRLWGADDARKCSPRVQIQSWSVGSNHQNT